jgi:hypothetical protein
MYLYTYGHLLDVFISGFWYFVSRKIWQPFLAAKSYQIAHFLVDRPGLLVGRQVLLEFDPQHFVFLANLNHGNLYKIDEMPLYGAASTQWCYSQLSDKVVCYNFYGIKRISIVLLADGNTIISGQFRPECINAHHFWSLDFYDLNIKT